jgi:tetratricopeptide (TPR) repeat protein
MRRRLVLLCCLVAAASAMADIVHLKDGGKIVGAVKRTSGGYSVTDDKGNTTIVMDDQVVSVEKVGTMTKDELAASALGALRRQVDALADVRQIITRFDSFIQQHKGTPAADDAARELTTWRDRQAKGMVKIGSRWVTAQEQIELFRKTLGLIEQARSLVKQSRLREADALVDQILIIDPANASGLYLKGVVLGMQDKFAPARAAFDQVRARLPDHGPTLNNIAVLLFRQKQYLGALAIYTQAMIASPANRDILNNVIEALHAAPDEHQKAEQITRAARHFNEQEPALQQQMAAQGLYRWGGTWINAQQLAEVKKAEQEIRGKLDQLQAEFDKLRNRIANIETEVAANNRAIERLEANRWGTDANGNIVYLPRSDASYRLERDNDVLRAERDSLMRRLGTFREREAAIRATAPQPKYTGLQVLIGAEGTPLVAPPAGPPATAPGAD